MEANKAPPEDGVPAIQHRCRKKYKAYTSCLSKFYSEEFLPGKKLEQDCQDVFDAWRECYTKGMIYELYIKKGKEPPQELLDQIE